MPNTANKLATKDTKDIKDTKDAQKEKINEKGQSGQHVGNNTNRPETRADDDNER